jgi:hypothetical protein
MKRESVPGLHRSEARSIYPGSRDVVYLCEKDAIARGVFGPNRTRYVAIDPTRRVRALARSVGYFRRCSDCGRSDRYHRELTIEPYEIIS